MRELEEIEEQATNQKTPDHNIQERRLEDRLGGRVIVRVEKMVLDSEEE